MTLPTSSLLTQTKYPYRFKCCQSNEAVKTANPEELALPVAPEGPLKGEESDEETTKHDASAEVAVEEPEVAAQTKRYQCCGVGVW